MFDECLMAFRENKLFVRQTLAAFGLLLYKNINIMDRKDFTENIKRIVANYEEDRAEMGPDPQLRINPLSLHASVVTAAEMQNEIAYTDEDIEAAAAAEGDETESSDDYEARQDPDFYPLRLLTADGAVDRLADKYF